MAAEPGASCRFGLGAYASVSALIVVGVCESGNDNLHPLIWLAR